MSVKVLPSAQHLEWADQEIGVIIHQDLQVYEHGYYFRDNWDYTPSPEVFNPSELNTDQWLEAAVNLGARYAVLVAKHCSGFSLWPTKAHDYSVASSPWKNGKGDVVAEFIKSCHKYGVKPGIYASCCNNAKYKFGWGRLIDGPDPARHRAYIDMMKTQLTELWSNYGELFEVWFDGGFPEDGGDEIVELLCKLQPQAIAFQGDPRRHHCVRWVGNERAVAPYPCHGAANEMGAFDGETEFELQPCFYGSLKGKFWMPGEADMPNRDQWAACQGGWFWRPGEDHTLYPPEYLLERYFTSVGRNCNFLLGMVIDNRGLVPDADFEQFKRTGDLIRNAFKTRLGGCSGKGFELEFEVPDGAKTTLISLSEEISKGENVTCFTVYGFDGEHYRFVATGSSIGHKHLIPVEPCSFRKWKVVVHGNIQGEIPEFRDFSAYSSL